MLPAWSQTALDRRISINFQQVTLEKALLQLIQQERVDLLFANEKLPRKVITQRFEQQPLRLILQRLLAQTGLSFQLLNQQVVIVPLPPGAPPVKTVTISGFVEQLASRERMVNALIYVANREVGATTNGFGFFSLSLPAGEVDLRISYLGCRPLTQRLEVHQDTVLEFALEHDLTLDEFTLTDAGVTNASGTQLDLTQVNRLPKFAGETDLVRALHLQPGIQTGADGVGGIFVRGGEAGHNLVIIDDVPIYNFNHGAGVLSIFNTSTIKSVELLKGAFPARYAGRLASVLDVRTRDGNRNFWEGSGEVGLIASRLTLEGPILGGKGSVLLSGRVAFLNWYLEPAVRQFKRNNNEDGSSNYDFYDFNGKINFDLSSKDKLYFSYYRGLDRFENYGSTLDSFQFWNNQLKHNFQHRRSYEERLNWRNLGGALRWNRVLGPQLFVNTTLTYSELKVDAGYDVRDSLQTINPTPELDYDWDVGEYRSSIKGYAARTDLHWAPLARHLIRFGASTEFNQFEPGVRNFDDANYEQVGRGEVFIGRPINAWSFNVYAEDTYRPNAQWRFDYGLHLANWRVDQRWYHSFEPRLAAYWQATPRLGWKLAVTRMAQFIHLLTSSNIGLPTDLWVPSTKNLAPEQAWQYSLGGDLQLSPHWQFSAEAYFKQMDHLVNYIEGANYLDNWEENVTSGSGRAFGIDFSLRKTLGRTTGWIAYSIARTDREFEKINFGNRYPFRFDHRHDLKMALLHTFSKTFELSASWMFGSGLAYSLPLDQFTVNVPGVPGTVVVQDFEAKNQYRLPAYLRLDLGLKINFSSKNQVKHTLMVGVYNALDRNNPLYYKLENRFKIENSRLISYREFVGVYLLPILPSLNYSVKF